MRSVDESGRRSRTRVRAVRFRIWNLRVTITPGALIESLLLTAALWALTSQTALLAALPTDSLHPSTAPIFGLTCFATTLVHEAGHLLCSLALRKKVHALHLGASSFIHHDCGDRMENLLILAAGPLTQTLAGITLLAFSIPGHNAALVMAGIFSVSSGLAQSAPLGPATSDGRQIWKLILQRPKPDFPDVEQSHSKAA